MWYLPNHQPSTSLTQSLKTRIPLCEDFSWVDTWIQHTSLCFFKTQIYQLNYCSLLCSNKDTWRAALNTFHFFSPLTCCETCMDSDDFVHFLWRLWNAISKEDHILLLNEAIFFLLHCQTWGLFPRFFSFWPTDKKRLRRKTLSRQHFWSIRKSASVWLDPFHREKDAMVCPCLG